MRKAVQIFEVIAGKSGASIIELRDKISNHESYIRDAKADNNFNVRSLSLDLTRLDY